MKPVIITVALVAAFFVLTFKVEATQCQGRSCDNVQGHECEQGQHRYNPHCSPRPTLTATPTSSPYATTNPSPTATASATTTSSPIATTIPTDSPSATQSPSAEPSNPSTPRTDLTDGRSDGLGCSVKDCSGNKIAGQSGQILPSTGDNSFVWTIVIAVLVLIIGLALKFIHKIAKEDCESLSRMHGSDDEKI